MKKYRTPTRYRVELREAFIDTYAPGMSDADWAVAAVALVAVCHGELPVPPVGSALWKSYRRHLGLRELLKETGESAPKARAQFYCVYRSAMVFFGDELGVDLRDAPLETVQAFEDAMYDYFTDVDNPRLDEVTVADVVSQRLTAEQTEACNAQMDAAARAAVLSLVAVDKSARSH
jgi:hypothetical protein